MRALVIGSPSTLLSLLLALTTAVCLVEGMDTCTEADKRWIWSPCVNGMKNSIEYFQAGCTPGDIITTQPPRPAACIKSCGSGQWWDPKDPWVCSTCPAGTMSNSGGHTINDFQEWPEGFTTFCSPEPCQPWQSGRSGTFLWSGNQSAGGERQSQWNTELADESVTSTLVFMVPVINDKGLGRIIFKYRTESEYHFDGLRVYTNGTLVKDTNAPDAWSPFLQSGWHSSWTSRTVELPLGLTEIRMVYTKDQNQNSMYGDGVGADAAFIRDLVVEGIQWYADECNDCVSGKFSVAGAKACKTCPNNQYSNKEVGMAGGCQSCTSGFWAPPGSAECRPEMACGPNDYVAVYTECDGGSHTRDLSWKLVSSRCDTALADVPAPQKDQPCADCAPGFYRDQDDWSCKACQTGLYYDTHLEKCVACSAGFAAIKEVLYEGFDTFGATINPEIFTMECQGECAGCTKAPDAKEDDDVGSCTVKGGGWTLSPAPSMAVGDNDHSTVVIRTDLDNGAEFNTSLSYQWESLGQGRVSFKYHFMRMSMQGIAAVDNEGYTAEATLDGKTTTLDKNFVNIEHYGTFSQFVPAGKHTLTIHFAQESTHTEEDPIAFMLQALHVVGDSRGGAHECTICPVGHYCPQGSEIPRECHVGTMQPLKGAISIYSCKDCPTGHVTAKTATTACTACDAGSVPNAAKVACDNTCRFTAQQYLQITTPQIPGIPTPVPAPVTTTGAPDYITQTNPPAGSVVLNTFQFDLTGLNGHVFGPIYLDGTDTEGLSMAQADMQNLHRFFVSPCTMVNTAAQSSICSGNQDTYSCQRVNVNQTYAAGDRVIYDYTHPNLRISYTGGDRCSHGDVPRSTNLTLLCDAEVGMPGKLSYRGESPHCHYNFVLNSPVGCPICTPMSYDRNVGLCQKSGKQKVSYYKNEMGSRCQGGWVPPANGEVACDYCQMTDAYYKETWDNCLFGKQHRIMLLKPEHLACVGDSTVNWPNVSRTCSTVDVRVGANGFTLFIGILIPVLLGLIIFGMCIFFKFANLQSKYARLQNDNGQGEMSDMNSFETAEETRQMAASATVKFTGGSDSGGGAASRSGVAEGVAAPDADTQALEQANQPHNTSDV